ncbi:hypothetical protein QEV83_02870 [Methylocapsa sp. D3K7]|uniref:hypothetical protein n=1 Tax=Methylocapsa sp. D3K7 TaxID=3041435 RepID=UPI00244E9B97|nr:hypothetical protein [Methylocapsa sp. D3K7]WGJ15260.1 hypothetical protein QEV83_02870 [Methylocapsa sp. D3K7]
MVRSHDRSWRINRVGVGEIGARWIDRGEGAAASAEEAVTGVGVTVLSRDRLRRKPLLDDQEEVPVIAPAELMAAGWKQEAKNLGHVEPGGSILVKVPVGPRRKPCIAPIASA